MARRGHDEERLFREAMEGVRPIEPAAHPAAPPKPEPRARFTRRDEAAVLEESLTGQLDPAHLETGDELVFARPGIRPGVVRKLRRGRYVVESELDLHGMTVAIARGAVAGFLQECIDLGQRCVRIIHGKGHRSGHRGPVLKGKIDLWLRRRDDVVAFASARQVDGGTGAVYVLLARRKRSSGA